MMFILEATFGMIVALFVAGIGFVLSSVFGIILYPIGMIIGWEIKQSKNSASNTSGVQGKVSPVPQQKCAFATPNQAAAPQKQSSSIWGTTTASLSGNWYTQTQSTSASAANSVRSVYDLDGNPLQLGTKDEKASGGEGTVYTMPSHSSVMIKLYKDSTLQNTTKMNEIKKRVEAMTKLSTCTSLKHLAWPLLPVADGKKQMIGFAMRACTGESFRSLGNIASIAKAFPKWNRLHLAQTALDFVVKVRELAKNNVIINDFNPSNFLVDRNCNVSMIDCDSYQIPDKNGKPLITHTYFASHVAPELMKNTKLMDSPRDIHHVEFGAAVVVFGVVMCGLHPYSFSDPSNRRKIGTPEENLLKGYCPFAPGSKLRFPQAPHDEWANLWSWLPTSLQDAFK